MVTVGLIADTHIPDRFRNLPPSVFAAFSDVELILHAGDVGSLRVLDQLAEIAPVVAVHGNDDPEIVTEALPYLQLLMIGGRRVVLCHTHYPDRTTELASRTDDWDEHFERRLRFARQYHADVIVYGHTHIPLVQQREGILIVNPGAIASRNLWMRQVIQTVAIIHLSPHEPPTVEHIDLNSGQLYTPAFDEDSFEATASYYNQPILSPTLYEQRGWLWNELRPVAPQDVQKVIRNLAFECWDNGHKLLTPEILAQALLALDNRRIRDTLRQNPTFAPYVT
ncbi:MAG: hypothetical protein CUN55_05660 [Phototrophicales bacterium]|nr:MAG: hypothetical protein CUN55_05660 [Phototrophicales bacterium]